MCARVDTGKENQDIPEQIYFVDIWVKPKIGVTLHEISVPRT